MSACVLKNGDANALFNDFDPDLWAALLRSKLLDPLNVYCQSKDRTLLFQALLNGWDEAVALLVAYAPALMDKMDPSTLIPPSNMCAIV